MAEVKGVVVKGTYAINTIIIDEDFVDQYRSELADQGKELFIDDDGGISIGDKWIEAYGGFFRPIGFLPYDVPDELLPPTPEEV